MDGNTLGVHNTHPVVTVSKYRSIPLLVIVYILHVASLKSHEKQRPFCLYASATAFCDEYLYSLSQTQQCHYLIFFQLFLNDHQETGTHVNIEPFDPHQLLFEYIKAGSFQMF